MLEKTRLEARQNWV